MTATSRVLRRLLLEQFYEESRQKLRHLRSAQRAAIMRMGVGKWI